MSPSCVSPTPVSHPLFARLQTWMTRREPARAVEHRRELLAGLSGTVLELGAGSGANFAHYPPAVTTVLAVEPEPYMRARASAAAPHAPVPVTVFDGAAERLLVEDLSCDAAVACLVLCSVADQSRALAELRRVLRDGGELRFYEHVLSHRPAVAASQHLVDRTFWPRAFGGCHTARDTPAAIVAAGFEMQELRRIWMPPVAVAVPVGTHALGRARKASP